MVDAGRSEQVLIAIKITHTVVWAFFVACIVGIPTAAWKQEFRVAVWLFVIVCLESVVLALNHWTCPLTTIAGRYTDERRPNFDIYLPRWIAQHNKVVFGALFLGGSILAVARWMLSPSS